MAVRVILHPETQDELFDEIRKNFPELMPVLLEDLRVCFESKGLILADYLGCDQPYGHPPAARSGQLRHIHVALPPQIFDSRRAQAYRKCSKEHPELDAAVVYAQGVLEEDLYVVLALFAPDAHDKAKNDAVMTRLGVLAKKWRDNN